MEHSASNTIQNNRPYYVWKISIVLNSSAIVACMCLFHFTFLLICIILPQVASEMNVAQRSKNANFLRTSCTDNWSVPFCNCEYPNETRWKHSTKKMLPCSCGEDTSRRLDWIWDKALTFETVVSGAEVIFHPVYSQGTTIVRGNEPLYRGRHHYWELKILSPLSGTDIVSFLVN